MLSRQKIIHKGNNKDTVFCLVYFLSQKFRMSDQYIEIGLRSAPPKLQPLFGNDPRADIDLMYKNKTFKLQKAHLRLQSRYFRKNLSIERSILEIQPDFNQQFFQKILSCFYGFKHQIMRCDSMNYFPIAEFLGIDVIEDQIRKDMIKNSSYYNIFELFQLSYKYNQQKIFQNCLNELENHRFSQILEERQAFLNTRLEIFKLVLTTHSRSPNKILNFYKIQGLIQKYGQVHNLPDDQVRHLKFELIDKSKLTSQQYREIFIKNNNNVRNTFNTQLKTLSLRNINSDEGPSSPNTPNNKYGGSSLSYQNYHRSLTLEMQHTWHKKINEELINDQKKIALDIKKLSQSTQLQFKKSQIVQRQFDTVKKQMSSYQEEEKQMNKKFKGIDSMLSQFENDFQENNKKILQVRKNLEEMLGKYDKKGKQSYNSDRKSFKKKEEAPIVEPQKTGVDLIFAKKPVSETPKKPPPNSAGNTQQKKMRNSPEAKQQQRVIKDEVFEKYKQQIIFDKKPSSIYYESELSALTEIIQADRFSKKNLKLIFRYSQNSQKIGHHKDINYFGDVLFLLRTKNKKLIGGFVHKMIDPSQRETADEKAYIFSVTSNKKFMIKKNQRHDAFSIEPGYIFCFRTDLMISQKWNQDQNFCSWPDSYANLPELEERGSQWMVGGDYQFTAIELECYKVEEEGMEMMII